MSHTRRLFRTVSWLSRPNKTDHEIPLCHDQRFPRSDRWFSHPPKLTKSSASKIIWGQDPDSPVGSIPFGKHVRDVMSDNGLSGKFVNKVCHPRTPEAWWLRQGFEDKVYHTVIQWRETRFWRQSLPRLSPTNPPRVTHCCETLTIHEGRSADPMNPHQPKFCFVTKQTLHRASISCFVTVACPFWAAI
jgi:hypothetical protein